MLFRGTSSLLCLAALAVVCSGLSAQAETDDFTPKTDAFARVPNHNSESNKTPIQSDQVTTFFVQEQVNVANSGSPDSVVKVLTESTIQEQDFSEIKLPTATASAEANQSPSNLSSETKQEIPEKTAIATSDAVNPEQIVDKRVKTSASALTVEPSTPQLPEAATTETTAPEIAQVDVIPGRATRSGPSYIGVAGNIGLGGDTTLSEGAFAVISKIGLTRNLSVRPAALFGDNTVFLVPLTYDFPSQGVEQIRYRVAPYIGGGVAISTGDDSTIGALITGGVDVPLSSQFTATAGVNVGFVDETEVGLLIGVGYTFSGL
ncbi:hypothetical protein NDI49_08530 [Trichocoleus sp. ST-U3]